MANRSRFDPDEEWSPEPQPEGRLGPPGRKPPTAIATATPRPPREPYRHGRYRGRGITQRIARGMLSVLLITSGAAVPILQTSLIGLAVGLGLGGLGAVVALRLLRQREGRRIVRLKERRQKPPRHEPGQSDAQSA